MPKSSVGGKEKLFKPRGKSISTFTAIEVVLVPGIAAKASNHSSKNPAIQHRRKLRALAVLILHRPPKRTVVMNELDMGLTFAGLASGKKPETSSGATHSSTPSHDNAFTGIDGDHEAVVPITELWNNAYEQLQREEPKLIEKYEAEISLHVSTMVGSTVAISGLGKVQRREQMQVLVKQKLDEDEDGKWTIPLGDDRIAIRELAGRVVSIVDWGKEFVGAALESSPYGSIAWAGVCLLLPVSTSSVMWGSNWCSSSRLLKYCSCYAGLQHDDVISV